MAACALQALEVALGAPRVLMLELAERVAAETLLRSTPGALPPGPCKGVSWAVDRGLYPFWHQCALVLKLAERRPLRHSCAPRPVRRE